MNNSALQQNQISLFSLVVLVSIILSISAAPVVIAANSSNVYLTDWDKGKVLQPYMPFMSVTPLTISLEDPRGIACGPGGMLYVAEMNERIIVRFTQEGGYKENVVKDTPSSTFSGRPLSLTFGPDGNLYFTTHDEGVWVLVDGDPRNQPERLIKGTYFDQDEIPFDLAFLKTGEYSGDMLVSVFTEKPYEGYVLRLPGPDFNQVRTFITEYTYEEMGNVKSQHLRVPSAIAVNDFGEIFIADHEQRENHILRYSPDGEFVDVFVESINNPLDMRFGNDGKLYAVLGALWNEESRAGGLKVYNKFGDQELFIPREDLWGVALCD